MSKKHFIKTFAILDENKKNALAGPNPEVKDLYGEILVDVLDNFSTIYNSDSNVINALYDGNNAPTVVVAGNTNQFVTVSIPYNCRLRKLNVIGLPTDVDSNGDRIIRFAGKGVVGNLNTNTLNLPTITKTGISSLNDGEPSIAFPWQLSSIDVGDVDITQIGRGEESYLELYLKGVDTIVDKHFFQFTW